MINRIPSIRVFISSPGDVKAERDLIHKALEGLEMRPTFRERLAIRPVAWDKLLAGTAMSAKLKPQEAINKGLPLPSQCDIVLVVFWSRMGTPFVAEDGKQYLSGTHWELMDALERAPHDRVVIYRRMSQPDSLKDVNHPDYEKNYDQYKRLRAFFDSELFYQDGQIQRGVTQYETLDEFRQMIERDLEQFALEILKEADAPPAPTPSPDAPPTVSSVSPTHGKPYDVLVATAPEERALGDEFAQLLTAVGLRATTLDSVMHPAAAANLVDQSASVLFLLTPQAKRAGRITRILTQKRRAGTDLPWLVALYAGDLQTSVPYGLMSVPMIDLRAQANGRTSYSAIADLMGKLAALTGQPVSVAASQALPTFEASLAAVAQDAPADSPPVYISYRSTDIQHIRPVVAALDSFGIGTWYDQRSIVGGDWRGEIERAIEGCKVVVAQVSANVIPGSWTLEDLAYADAWGKAFVPLALDNSFYSADAPYPLGHHDMLDWSPGLDPLRHNQVLLRLRDRVKAYL
ncbi:MAG: TIR domain-containing protein [Anaerolineae bacterium]|jgi:hypothetical protein|nr:TIR domain-containing protein [Anaerolineae bacterium]